MSAPFQFTPQTPRPYPQPPPLAPQWFTAQHQHQQQHPQHRRQPRFDPNSFSAAATPSHPRPHPRPPTPYARNPQLPDTPYPPPAAPSYQPYSSYSPWVPVIPPDYDSDSTDKDPDSPLSGPPGPNNLQPRPHYWRSHYPNKRLQCPLTRFFSSQEQHIRLNPLLHYKSKKDPPMRYDLCVLPSQDHQFTLPAFHRRPSPRDMRQFATDPPVQHIRLWHHLLPSYIDITTTNRYDDDEGDGAITIGDLLEQLHSDLRRRISPYDYWTTALTTKKREQLDNTCNYRASIRGPAGDRAICHIDFLDKEFLFVGMIPCSNGTFEFKTIPIL